LLLFDFNRKPERVPLSHSVFEPSSVVSTRTEQGHRLISKDTIRASAIGNDLFLQREFRETCFQLRYGHGTCLRQMGSGIFLNRPDIQQDHLIFAEQVKQLVVLLTAGIVTTVAFVKMGVL